MTINDYFSEYFKSTLLLCEENPANPQRVNSLEPFHQTDRILVLNQLKPAAMLQNIPNQHMLNAQ